MKKSRKILIGILVCIIIGCVSYIAYYYIKQDRNEKVYEEVQKEAESRWKRKKRKHRKNTHVEIPINFETRQRIRIFMRGFRLTGQILITLSVQSATHNEYYLNHTIEGQEGYPVLIYKQKMEIQRNLPSLIPSYMA